MLTLLIFIILSIKDDVEYTVKKTVRRIFIIIDIFIILGIILILFFNKMRA